MEWDGRLFKLNLSFDRNASPSTYFSNYIMLPFFINDPINGKRTVDTTMVRTLCFLFISKMSIIMIIIKVN